MSTPENTYDLNLQEIHDFAVDLAIRAGTQLKDAAMNRTEVQSSVDKDSQVDVVTQADLDAEQLIKSAIEERYPTHKFVGEETYSKGSSRDYCIGSEPTWCVDPLDGTVNYIHLFPMFCVSIALIVHGKPTIGVIYAPLLNSLFSAIRGHGAYHNRTQKLPIHLTPIPPQAPQKCIFSCEWGKDRRDPSLHNSNLKRKTESFINMATELGGRGGKGGMVHGVRSLGSATLDLAYVAMGAFDIWWEAGCWEWDVAAGICILEEAGGLVTTANPPADVEQGEIVEAKLGGRLYLAIRPAKDVEGETGREAQERLVREVWKRVEPLDYIRPGT